MTRYAVRAVPWARVALAAGLVVLLMELVRWNPWVLWPLEGTAVGLLAGAAAWCFDESAAAVVDVAPRGLAWRTAARAPTVLALALVWCSVVSNSALFGHRVDVLTQGLVALAVGTAYAVARRAWGQPSPGLLLATFVVPATSVWALVRPFDTRLPVFPYGDDTVRAWAASTTAWLAVGVVALVVLGMVLAGARWWPARSGGARAGWREPTPATRLP